MRKNIIYKKILPQDILKIFSLFLVVVCLWDGLWRLREKEVYQLYYSLIYVFALFALYWAADIWKNHIVRRIGDLEKLETARYKTGGKIILLAMNVFIALLFGVVNYYCSYGESIEDLYRKRYLCADNEPIVFYSEKIGDYEVAVLGEAERTSYCVFQNTKGSDYKFKSISRTDNYSENDLFKVNMSENQKESAREFFAIWEIQGVIMGFYKDSDVFQGERECVGISYSPMVKNVEINGNPIHIERIANANGRQGYFWRIKVDLEEEISVEYIQPSE